MNAFYSLLIILVGILLAIQYISLLGKFLEGCNSTTQDDLSVCEPYETKKALLLDLIPLSFYIRRREKIFSHIKCCLNNLK